MFKKDGDLIHHSLHLWANYIETGDILISAKDAIDMKKHKKIKSLDIYQEKLIDRIRELGDNCFDKKIQIIGK